MPETKSQDQQRVTRPALKPFVRPAQAEAPALQPIAPVFGRVTLPPFGPIRYGGPKPGAAVIDDEAPSWASIESPAPEPEPEPEPEAEEEPTPILALAEAAALESTRQTPVMTEVIEEVVEAEPEPVAEVVEEELALPPEPEHREYAEREAPAWLDAAPEVEAPRAWEPMTRRPVLPLTGPNDPTPVMNPTIERTTTPVMNPTIERTTTPVMNPTIERTTTPIVNPPIERMTTPIANPTIERTTTPIANPTIERTNDPHRMTPTRVTSLRPTPVLSAPAVPAEGNARGIAAALELIAARVRRGDLVVAGSMPANDDPPALAAALAATLAALLGVRT